MSRLQCTLTAFALLALLLAPASHAAGGRLPATGGATQLEGAAGGGLVPWAMLAGYATEDQIGANAFITQVNSTDFNLHAFGASATFYNRLELSAAHRVLGIAAGILDGSSVRIAQDVLGLKLRLAGDVVYTALPQVSLGLQYKRNRNGELVVGALGAARDSDWDAYLATSRLFLGAAGGYNLLLNGTLRATRANELGLLGFGGAENDSHELMLEAAAAVLLDPRTAIGVEYRRKPDNLGLGEEHWKDLFIAWFPSKQLALTAAYTRLGDVGPMLSQDALYLSLQGSF